MDRNSNVYAALLRGINVGGKNKIKMAELKLLFEELGFNRVETYIQSGNVIFESAGQEGTVKERIEQEILKKFGFPVEVILRTEDELENIIRDCPFTKEEIKQAESLNQEGESLYVSLLAQEPLAKKLESLEAYAGESDQYRCNHREIYFLFRHSIRNSKLANNLHRLDEPNTVRNWKTMQKLFDLVKARS